MNALGSAVPRSSLLTLALVMLGGCENRRESPSPPPGLALGPASLADGTYIVGVPGGLDTVTLAGGRARDETTGAQTTLLPISTWGDLSGDDRREVVAVVVTRLPGRGALHEMVVVADAGGRPVQIAHEFLGDRVDVEGLSVAERIVTVQMQIHGPNDPACCPTQRVSRRFSVQGRSASP